MTPKEKRNLAIAVGVGVTAVGVGVGVAMLFGRDEMTATVVKGSAQVGLELVPTRPPPVLLSGTVTQSGVPTGTGITREPRPGVLVEVTEGNTRTLRVYANDAGLKYVKISDRVQALAWRAYIGETKKFANYSNSRFQPIDELIGKDSLLSKLRNKLADAIQAVGNFFAVKMAKAGDEIAQLLTNNELSILNGDKQTAARDIVITTADEFVRFIARHPANSGLRSTWRPSAYGPVASLAVTNGDLVYIPTPTEIQAGCCDS